MTFFHSSYNDWNNIFNFYYHRNIIMSFSIANARYNSFFFFLRIIIIFALWTVYTYLISLFMLGVRFISKNLTRLRLRIITIFTLGKNKYEFFVPIIFVIIIFESVTNETKIIIIARKVIRENKLREFKWHATK